MWKKAIIGILIVIIAVQGIALYFQSMRFKEAELKHMSNYGQQSFGIMMHVYGEILETLDLFDSGDLTDDELESYYDNMDEYILSVYNQEPFRFIDNLRLMRFARRYTVEEFDEEVALKYRVLSDFLFSSYVEVENNYTDDEFLDFYHLYISDEFNAELSQMINELGID